MERVSPVHDGASPLSYAFGPFVLDPAEGQLLKDGAPIKVPGKALEMLLALVKRPGRLVTKAELLAEVWPGLFVEEGNITVNMSLLRRALGDDGADSGYIETVPRRGYRFTADVQHIARSPLTTPVRAEPVVASPARSARSRLRQRSAWIGGLVAVLALTTAGTIYMKGTRPASDGARLVIVMPFTPLATSSDQAYLEVGMAEALIARLGRLGSLRVTPIAALRPSEDPFVAAARLGASAVLTGSVQQRGDELRVTVQLTDPTDHGVIWGDHFSEKSSDIFVLQDKIAERIAVSLVRSVSAADRTALTHRDTRSSLAYDYYLRAREQWSTRSPESVRAALVLYHQAIATDTNFALAYAGLADAYNITRSGLRAAERYPLAKQAAERALALDDQLAAAHTSRAFQHYKFEWRWDEAIVRFKRAIELDPSYALAHHWYGECLYLLGRTAESEVEYRRALALDPYSRAILYDLARTLMRAGNLVGAREHLEQGLRLDRNDPQLLGGLADLLALEGKEAESVEVRWRSMMLLGAAVADVDALRAAYKRGGLRALHLETAAQLHVRAERGEAWAATGLAQAYGRLEDREKTLHWLRQAIAKREDAGVQLRSKREFDFLHDDPEFQQLVVQVGMGGGR